VSGGEPEEDEEDEDEDEDWVDLRWVVQFNTDD
jgi:hypothetical protein